jgi:hypothetical protein
MPIVIDKKSLNSLNIVRFNTVVQDCISNGNITAENVEIFQSISSQVQRYKTSSNISEYEKNAKLISEVLLVDVKTDFTDVLATNLDVETSDPIVQLPDILPAINVTKRNINTSAGQTKQYDTSENTDTTSGERIQVLLQDQKVVIFYKSSSFATHSCSYHTLTFSPSLNLNNNNCFPQ